jgi:cytochrome c5
MSDAQHHLTEADADFQAAHEGPIKTPKQLAVTIFLSFLLPVLIIIMLTNFVAWGSKPAAGSDGLAAEAVARRIQPVGAIEIKDASDPSTLKSGEQVFAAQCTACHTAGVAGAPKLGDGEAWAARIKTGYDALLGSALKGKGSMGAQGGGDFSDLEIGRAVVFMVNKAGAKFEEPKPAAAPAQAAAK